LWALRTSEKIRRNKNLNLAGFFERYVIVGFQLKTIDVPQPAQPAEPTGEEMQKFKFDVSSTFNQSIN
jgi:hypothetical protein